MPVPVGPGSDVGLFHDVLIDVGDEQSMQQSLSTFSGHLKRLLDMLKRAGQRALVLIDELGAGTDPEEGAAIGQALLDEFLKLKTRCIVTTHLGVLKAYSLTRDRAENASVEFDVETLRPTFHLRIGESGSSNAIDVAQRLGMPRRLANAARRNISQKAKALGAALRGTSRAKRQAEQARQAAEKAQMKADEAHGEAQKARTRLEQQQAEFQTWVQRVVHLQPGDAVRVRNFDRDGRVVRVRLEQQRAEVDVGAFAVEVPLGDVLPPETSPPPPRPPMPRPAPAPAAPAADEKPKRTKRPDRRPSQPKDHRPQRSDKPAGDRPRPQKRPPAPAADARADRGPTDRRHGIRKAFPPHRRRGHRQARQADRRSQPRPARDRSPLRRPGPTRRPPAPVAKRAPLNPSPKRKRGCACGRQPRPRASVNNHVAATHSPQARVAHQSGHNRPRERHPRNPLPPHLPEGIITRRASRATGRP